MSNKVCVITASSSGIGAAGAILFAQAADFQNLYAVNVIGPFQVLMARAPAWYTWSMPAAAWALGTFTPA